MLSTETIITRLVLAFALGAVVGLEREFRNKSAGLRTMTLICLGSCLFTLVSILINMGTEDRIASTIVTGIGFIGAGVIFKSEKGVNGLTTAASIWVTAAIGMAVGSGNYIAASVTCVATLIILSLLTFVENLVDKINKEREYVVITQYEPGILEKFEKLIHDHHLQPLGKKNTRRGSELKTVWTLQGKEHNHKLFVDTLLRDSSVKEFEF